MVHTLFAAAAAAPAPPTCAAFVQSRALRRASELPPADATPRRENAAGADRKSISRGYRHRAVDQEVISWKLKLRVALMGWGVGGAVVPIVLSTFVKRLCASASCTRRCARCGNGRNKTAPGAEVRRDAARQRRRPRAPGRTSALFGARRGAASGPPLLPPLSFSPRRGSRFFSCRG